MNRFLILCITLISIAGFFFLAVPKTSSDELNDINKQINELTQALDMSIKATKPLESQLNSMQKQIAEIKSRVAVIENDIAKKKKNINEGYKNLEKQEKILARTIRNFYIKSYYNSPLLTFLSAQSASEITQILAYQRAAADQDKAIITNIALTISDLETKKKGLESEQARLAVIKADLSEQSAKLDKIVSGAKAYQSSLSSKIATLTAQQQQLINQRLAALGIPRSAGTSARGCIDDRDIDPGFSPRLAFFTYGVPNRVGMNQYGAYGRARANQDYQTILRAYYNFDELKDVDVNTQIRIDGHGSYGLEDYVKRIYEVPNSWGDNGGMEALKAQAIAARSYAMAYTNNGAGSICDSQKCQVFQDGEKGGNWNTAVEATRGKVMAQGGNVIKAWYSSTHGGYVLSSNEIGWDSTSWTKHAIDTTSGPVGNFGELQSNAYDKDSPWFYCDWGSRGDKKTAWLKTEEVADIANVILLVRKNSSAACFVYQTDKAPPPPNPSQGCAQTDNWSADKVKQELGEEALSTATSVEVTGVDWGSGKTTQIKINGIPFDGNEFKNWFNVRAPANIQIVGPLYNIERR